MDFEKIVSENPHLIESLVAKNVDPHFFNDPFALQVSFKPLSPGGRENHAYSLIDDASGDLRFEANSFEAYFVKIIAFISFILTIYFCLSVFRPDLLGQSLPETIDTFSWLRIFFSATFFLASLNENFTLKNKTRISQKHRKVFLKGKKPISFESIHAIQFLLEFCAQNNQTSSPLFLSYETNIILKNKERIQLIEQGGYLAGLKDANKIAHALKVPLWDGVKARIKTKEVITR